MLSRVMKKGIQLVSRCECCNSPRLETINHLFFQSNMAQDVWKHFSGILHKPSDMRSINHLIYAWTHGTSRRSQLDMVTLTIIFCGCWFIWKERCRLRFEGGQRDSMRLIQKIRLYVMEVSQQFRPRRIPTTWEEIILEHLQCKAVREQNRTYRIYIQNQHGSMWLNQMITRVEEV